MTIQLPAPPVVPSAVSATGATANLSFTAGERETAYQVTLTHNCAITINAAATGQDQLMTVDLIQGGSGGYTPSFVGASWAGGVAPTLNTVAGLVDTVMFRGVGNDVQGIPVCLGRTPTIPAVPGAPTGPSATVSGSTSLSISANAVTAYPAVTGYTIKRGTTPGGESGTPIATNTSLPYSDTGLTTGTTYYYVIAAVNSVGTGAYSSEVSATPAVGTHYATVTNSGSSPFPYVGLTTQQNPAFNPGSAVFDVRVFVRMSAWGVNGSFLYTTLWSEWAQDASIAYRWFWFGIDPTGALHASWATAGAGGDVTSSAIISAAGNSDLWLRITVTPLAGTAAFYTSTDGTTWTALGTTQTTNTGAIYCAAGNCYTQLFSNYGATSNATAQVFVGRFYQGQLTINGVVVSAPYATATGMLDTQGISWSTSATEVAYT